MTPHNMMLEGVSVIAFAVGLATTFYVFWMDVTQKPRHLVYQGMWAAVVVLLISIRIGMFVK